MNDEIRLDPDEPESDQDESHQDKPNQDESDLERKRSGQGKLNQDEPDRTKSYQDGSESNLMLKPTERLHRSYVRFLHRAARDFLLDTEEGQAIPSQGPPL